MAKIAYIAHNMSSQAHTLFMNDDVYHAIAATPLFLGAQAHDLEPFIERAHITQEPKGKILFLQEDEANYFYIILSGWVKLFRETLEGTEAIIDILNAGYLLGDTSVFEQSRYSYGAEIVENARIIMIPASLLHSSIESNHTIALNMLSSMARHRRQQNREIEHLNLKNASQRIGCFLLRLCPKSLSDAVTLNLPYDKALIAARLGMKPETFSRALAKLKVDTHITISGSTVHIHNLQNLVEYTCNYCSSSFPCEDIKD